MSDTDTDRERREAAIAPYAWTDNEDGEERMDPADAHDLMEAEATHQAAKLAEAEARAEKAEGERERLRELLRQARSIREDGDRHLNGPDAMWSRWHTWDDSVRAALSPTPESETPDGE